MSTQQLRRAAAVLAFSLAGSAFGGTVVYVDLDATGANDGTSWQNAFTELSAALSFAAVQGNGVSEIWVAEGAYTPSPIQRNREVSFALVGEVAVYGGFTGGEAALSERDPSTHLTVLTGDLNGDDASGSGTSDCCGSHSGPGCSDDACEAAVCAEDSFCCTDTWDATCAARTECLCGSLCSTKCDNSFHVVTATGVSGAILDGFTVRGGLANGGILAHRQGGGMRIIASAVRVIGCVFEGNTSDATGGAVHVFGATPQTRFVNCRFVSNESGLGGAMYMEEGGAVVVNSAFFANQATDDGGAIRARTGTPVVVNCVFSGNRALGGGGGAISVDTGALTLSLCSLSANAATPTGSGGGLRLTNATVSVSNSVFWGNFDSAGGGEGGQIRKVSGTLSLNYSLVQGLTGALGGVGNVGGDPLFVDADGPDNVAGTPDDNLRVQIGSSTTDAGSNALVAPDSADLDGDGDLVEPTPVDFSGAARRLDDPGAPDTGSGVAPIVDMGAFELKADCNGNGVRDTQDVALGFSDDCNANMVPDECEIDADSTAPGGPFYCIPPCDPDCNHSGTPDACDITAGGSGDFDGNGVPDECQPDCNANGFPDFLDILFLISNDCDDNAIPDECEGDCNSNGIADRCDINDCTVDPACKDCNNNALPDGCDIAAGAPDCNGNEVPDECEPDCNHNGRPDTCDIADGTAPDCNTNAVPDACDIAAGTSEDCDEDGVPDECEADCNSNGVNDGCDILLGTSEDCNANGVPDECDLSSGSSLDCNANVIPDECDIAGGAAQDCQPNGVPDSCDIASGASPDEDGNGVPDECKPDCNGNDVPDAIDIFNGTSLDCDGNEVPDECQPDCNANQVADPCDISGGGSVDCQPNGVPDECEDDCDSNQVPDDCDLANGAPDLNHNGILDRCEPDCNDNGFPDFLDLFFGASEDCNANEVPDECDIGGVSQDANGNQIPDECDPFADGDSDGDVDLADVARFGNCFTGASGVPLGTGCAFFSVDDDTDVDLADLAALTELLVGP